MNQGGDRDGGGCLEVASRAGSSAFKRTIRDMRDHEKHERRMKTGKVD